MPYIELSEYEDLGEVGQWFPLSGGPLYGPIEHPATLRITAAVSLELVALTGSVTIEQGTSVGTGNYLMVWNDNAWEVGYTGWGAWTILMAEEDGGGAYTGGRLVMRGADDGTKYEDWHSRPSQNDYLITHQTDDEDSDTQAFKLDPDDALGYVFGSIINRTSKEVSVPGVIGVGALPWRWIAPFDCTLISVTPSAGTAPVGSTAWFDINLDGTTMFTDQDDRPNLTTTTQDGTKTWPAITAITAGDVVTAEVDAVGSGTAGANVTLILELQI